MTKKEIEDDIWNNKEINTIGKVEAQNAVDLMQEEFDNRTCENCKHYKSKCEHGVTVPLFSTLTTKDFGCNKFEKDEK